MKKNKITNYLHPLLTGALIFFSVAFISCSKSDDGSYGGGGTGSGSASTAIKITDAPIDDANVSGVFVTIADVKLDGISVQGFTKTTVDLAAYQNGATKTLGNFSLAGKTYSNISFVLDYNTDANGNAPGCYVLSTTAVKHKLQTTSNVITVAKSYTLQAGASNSIVADFDLRKMVVHQAGASDHYDFATAAELQSHVRLMVENQTGTVSGTLNDNISGSAKVIAYAYKKGTFNRATELSGQGASSIQFSNAVTSSLATGGIIGGSYQYQLHFLESGVYEVYFASYKDTNADGEFELQGTLVVVAGGGLDLLNLSVSANTTLTVNATATGVMP